MMFRSQAFKPHSSKGVAFADFVALVPIIEIHQHDSRVLESYGAAPLAFSSFVGFSGMLYVPETCLRRRQSPTIRISTSGLKAELVASN